MTLQDKFEDVMKSYPTVTSINNELKHSNDKLK